MRIPERRVVGRAALAALTGATLAIVPAACAPAGGAWTPAAMKQYVDSFESGFIGLSGSPAEIAVAATAWGVSYRRLPASSDGAGYPMAHSTEVYLVDPQGLLRNHIFFGAGPRLIADLIRASRG